MAAAALLTRISIGPPSASTASGTMRRRSASSVRSATTMATFMPGCRDRFVDLLRSQYLPGAEVRGLELVDLALAPPVDVPDAETGVVLTWHLDGIDGFWKTRRATIEDPNVAAFWDATAGFIARRTRRFAQTSLTTGP